MFDVTCRILIARPPDGVARIMFDAAHDPAWIGGVKTVAPPRPGPPALGQRVGRAGAFLGKRIAWTTEIVAHVPNAALQLRITDGPFAGDVHYAIAAAPGGSDVSIRNVGRAKGMPDWLARPMVRRGVNADLARLKRLVERAGA